MIQVFVDFNSRGHGGLVKASGRRADGPLHTGMKVLAVEPDEEDMRYVATVEAFDEATGIGWLEVHWEVAPPAAIFTVTSSTLQVDPDETLNGSLSVLKTSLD